ncbi:MAG: hypothetical protein AAF670_09675 [Planctomycetota bacterium]
MNLSLRHQPARLLDLPGLLIGLHGSVVRLIHGRRAIVLGAALVGTAAMAREYDAVSLRHEPLDLLAPFAASIVLSSGLFVWFWFWMASTKIHLRHPFRSYVVFVTAYWMTAPLAWLYAIPVEMHYDEITSMRFNLTMLSVVSVWRVILFARLASVQFRIGFPLSLSLTLVPCMAVAFVALLQSSMSIVGVMGGIRLTESQKMLVSYQGTVINGISLAFIPTAFAMIALLVASRRTSKRSCSHYMGPRLSVSLWSVPALATIVFAVAMTFTQPKLHRARVVDDHLIADDLSAAIRSMQSNDEQDFPRTWDPPPRHPSRDPIQPSLQAIAGVLQAETPDPWIVHRLTRHADKIAIRRTNRYGRSSIDSSVKGDRIRGSIETLEATRSDVDALLLVPNLDETLQQDLMRLQRILETSIQATIEEELPGG